MFSRRADSPYQRRNPWEKTINRPSNVQFNKQHITSQGILLNHILCKLFSDKGSRTVEKTRKTSDNVTATCGWFPSQLINKIPSPNICLLLSTVYHKLNAIKTLSQCLPHPITTQSLQRASARPHISLTQTNATSYSSVISSGPMMCLPALHRITSI